MKGLSLMSGYTPPYQITDRMLQQVASISEKIGQIHILKDLETKPHLRRNNQIKSIHSSLKIEANSLSLSQVRDVIDGQLVLGEQREIQEVKNAYAAYKKLEEINPYSVEELKKIHGIMTAGLIEESGRFRRGNEGVFHGEKCIFIAPPPEMVPGLVNSLFSWMETAGESLHPLILSAVFHYEFVFIHPFSDGNGRMARLWHTAVLAKWKPVFAYIPIESQIEKFQDEYYNAISQCHANGSSDVFVEFILEQIDAVLDDVLRQIKKSGGESSEYVRRLLEVMEYGIPYTAKWMMEQLGLRSRETFRKNYLNPAMEQGLVKMTIPQKPNSRNQRYVKL